jgi:hypothetical protein
LFVLVDLESESFEGAIGKEVEIYEDDGEDKAAHFVYTL